MTILDILREKLIGKTIIGDSRGNNGSIVGARIVDIKLDQYEPMFNLFLEKEGRIECVSYLEDWDIAVK